MFLNMEGLIHFAMCGHVIRSFNKNIQIAFWD